MDTLTGSKDSTDYLFEPGGITVPGFGVSSIRIALDSQDRECVARQAAFIDSGFENISER
jgi:hypothetical protein